MNLREKVSETLKELPLETASIEIGPSSGPTMFATIESSTFADMEEFERQEMVWEALRAKLRADELVAIEFVFTYAPGEDVEEAS